MPLFWLDALSACLFLHVAQGIDRSPQGQIESRVGQWENLEDDVDSTTSDVKANARMPLSLG